MKDQTSSRSQPISDAPDGATTEKPASSAAFTPGPWRVDPDAKHPWIVECPTNHPDFYGRVCTIGFKPNAWLVAAAPDLFDALRDCAEYLAKRGQRNDEAWGLFSHAIAALDKALGPSAQDTSERSVLAREDQSQ